MDGRLSSSGPSPMKPKMSAKRSGVENLAISAPGLASRLSRKPAEMPIDPEQIKPMLEVEEAGSPLPPDEPKVGSMIVGAKLSTKELCISWAGVVVLTLGNLFGDVGNFVVAYFFAQLNKDVGLTDAQYGLLTGYAYYLLNAIAMSLIGYVVEKYSLNRLRFVGLVSLTGAAALILQGFAKNFTMLAVGMLLSSLGGAVLSTLPIPIMSDLLPPEQFNLGSAFFSSSNYLAELVAGNLAFVFIKFGISWRWSLIMLGASWFATSIATLCIKEPELGRFIVKSKAADTEAGEEAKPEVKEEFSVRQCLVYMMSMKSFWLVTIACAMRLMVEVNTANNLPEVLRTTYPGQPAAASAQATTVGCMGALTSALYGVICQRFFVKMPALSFYTTGIGSLVAIPFVTMLFYSRVISGGLADKGLAIAITSLALGILFSEGWQGPTSVTVATTLPHHMKSFAMSQYAAVTFLISPAASNIMGIYLTAGGWKDGKPKYLAHQRAFMLIVTVGGYISSCVLYLLAVKPVSEDIAKREAYMRSHDAQITLSKTRRAMFTAGAVFISAGTLLLIGLSLIFSYSPDLVVHHKAMAQG